MRRIGVLILAVSFLTAAQQDLMNIYHRISSHSILKTIQVLASEEYGGRLAGSEGHAKAARYIAEQLRKAGLEPLFNGSYFQPFRVDRTEIVSAGYLKLLLPAGKGEYIEKPYRIYRDYVPAGYSGSGEVEGEAVFVGYGITAPEYGYDDYKGINVRGKIVIFMRGAPENNYQKWKNYWAHSYKLKRAHELGAKGVLYFMGAIASPNGTHIEGFPVVNVSKSVVQDLFAGTGKKVDDIIKRIRKKVKPFSFRTRKKVALRVESRFYPGSETFNVGAVLRGSTAPDEYIIFGAHLDHCGRAPETFYGADDNASGSAVVLELARAFARLKKKPARSIVFLFFSGEEMGLLGSRYFVEHPPFPLSKVVAMFNFDMVGIGENIFVGGGKNFPDIYRHVEEVNKNYIRRNLKTAAIGKGRPGSDHAPFFEKGVKAFFVATGGGGHPVYYHRREDTPSTITPEIAEDVARMFFLVGCRLAGLN